jgi:hypothetical protein
VAIFWGNLAQGIELMSFENIVAVVIDAGSGIAKACAAAPTQNAASVAVADLNVESAGVAATWISAAGGVAQAGVQIR